MGIGTWFARGVAVVASVVATVSCVEGASSLALFAWDASRPLPPVAESLHTHYDSLLGWASVPNRDVPDMYGPGVYLRTEAHGFRKNAEVTARVPAGMVRAICSGDSFTLGYGVDNDNTWCQLLEDEDGRLDTVNMGVAAMASTRHFSPTSATRRALRTSFSCSRSSPPTSSACARRSSSATRSPRSRSSTASSWCATCPFRSVRRRRAPSRG